MSRAICTCYELPYSRPDHSLLEAPIGCLDRNVAGNYIADSFRNRVTKVLHGMGAGSDKRSRSRKGGMPI